MVVLIPIFADCVSPDDFVLMPLHLFTLSIALASFSPTRDWLMHVHNICARRASARREEAPPLPAPPVVACRAALTWTLDDGRADTGPVVVPRKRISAELIAGSFTALSSGDRVWRRFYATPNTISNALSSGNEVVGIPGPLMLPALVGGASRRSSPPDQPGCTTKKNEKTQELP
jgi:hypothetical protein